MITKNKKKIFSFFLTLFVGGGIFFLVPSAHAAIGDWAGEVIGGLIGWIISAFGLILVLVMKALVLVAQYSNFIASPAVSNGWKMVRDICNMFFVLVLLIIAFATILKIENYSYKKWLPKLILMAILINFSKTICGLLIDFAQVVMLTFVNAFKDIAAGNLITNLGITDILTLAQTSSDIGFWEIIGSYVLGLIYIMIALVVIVTMLAMLVMRIVMIWIYVVLSPAAYLFSAFPGGQKYASQWWTEFTKNLIVGPVLAFFIWLSFVSLQTPTWINTDFKVTDDTTSSIATEAGMSTTYDKGASTTGTNAATSGVFIKFIIAIGMLIGGLKISQEIGGAAGSMAGKGMAKIQQGAAFSGKWAGKKATSMGLATGRTIKHVGGAVAGGIDRTLGAGVDWVSKKERKDGTVFQTNFANRGLIGGTVAGVKNLPGNIYTKTVARINKKKDINEKRREYLEQEKKVGENAAVLSYNGKRYKKEKEGENRDKFYEVDEKGKTVLSENNEKNFLKTKANNQGKEKEVTAMSPAAAAWRDAWRDTGTKSRTIANKEEEKKITDEQQKFADSGMTNDEMRRILISTTASATQKKAASMTLATKGGFKTNQEVDEAKKYVGSNTLLNSKFNDLVDTNQAHLNYDLTIDKVTGKFKNEADVLKFKERVDFGKVNSTKLKAEAFKNDDGGLLKTLAEFHGKEFNSVMEANYKQSKTHADAVDNDLNRNIKYDKTTKKIDPEDKYAKLETKLTGQAEKSFTIDGKLDEEGLQNYVKEAKVIDLNKMDAKNIDASQIADSLKKVIAEGLDFSKLKGMLKQGDNPKLVSMFANYMVKSHHADREQIQADRELNSMLEDSNKISLAASEKNKSDDNQGGGRSRVRVTGFNMDSQSKNNQNQTNQRGNTSNNLTSDANQNSGNSSSINSKSNNSNINTPPII